MSNWINHVNNLYTVQKCVLPSEKENLLEFYNNSSESEQEELNSDPVLHSELILKSLRKNADFTSGSLGVQEKEKGGMSDFNLSHFNFFKWFKVKRNLKNYCKIKDSELVVKRMSYYKSVAQESFSVKYLNDLRTKKDKRIPHPEKRSLDTVCP